LLLWKIEEIAMGTLSKRRLDEFGLDVKQRIEHMRRGVGKKLDDIGARVTTSTRPEGKLARGFGKVSSILPSSGWLGLAVASIAGSIGLKIARRHSGATFVAAWVPTFLLLGLYNMNKRPVTAAVSDDHGLH
jgi:hypothetical protein